MPLIGAFKDLFPGGSPLFWIVLISAIAASYVWFHWVDALKEGGRDRARLLRRLRRGGDWRDQYVWRLRRFLAHVDRFLGDTRRPGPACRWVTGGGPWPCWTARSFDICALMALVYPFLSIYATWLWSGEAGDLGRGGEGSGDHGRTFSGALVAPSRALLASDTACQGQRAAESGFDVIIDKLCSVNCSR